MPLIRKRLGRSLDIQKLEDMLRRHTEGFERMFLVIDAINESETTDEIENTLWNLAKFCKNLRLLISSTSSPKQTWSDVSPSTLEETFMSTKTINEDICNYVDQKIAENSSLKLFSESLSQEIKDAILGSANGV